MLNIEHLNEKQQHILESLVEEMGSKGGDSFILLASFNLKESGNSPSVLAVSNTNAFTAAGAAAKLREEAFKAFLSN